MHRTLTLHIGTPKSGTTHLQAILHRLRGPLRRQGLLYPGSGYLPRDGFNQQPAIYALAGRTIGWVDDAVRAGARAPFSRLCEEVSVHAGRVLISAESLAFFEAGQAQALLDRLGFCPASVTVVITARDYGRLLPSIWQQNVKNGSTEELRPYLDSVAALRGQRDAPFWTAFRLPDLVQRWGQVVGPERVTLVTAPPAGADKAELWSRYATATGLSPSLVDGMPERARADDNVSLTPSQTELLRRMNVVMRDSGYTKDLERHLRGQLLQAWMNAPRSARLGLSVPQHLREPVLEWGEEDALLLRRLGVRVVGALSDLLPVFPPQGGSASGTEPGVIDLETVRDVLALVEHEPSPPVRPARARWGIRLGFGAPARRAPDTRPVPRIDLPSGAESSSEARTSTLPSPPR
jgi:hypothetical protein